MSGWRPVPHGVPQGACLSALLWSLFSADVADHIRSARVVQFADDTTLVSRGRTLAEAREAMNRALEEFAVWSRNNSVAPEPKKTRLLISASPARLVTVGERCCTMNGRSISPKDVIDILGVQLDASLSWDAQPEAARVSPTKRASRSSALPGT